MDENKIFLALKSNTRREILKLLASEPMYLTQISTRLDLGQQAIFRHLQKLEEAGLLDSQFQKAGQGAPRRYYQIARQVRVEVQISPEMFDVGLFDVPEIKIKRPKDFPELAEITEECTELSRTPNSKEKLRQFSSLLSRLGERLDKINRSKAIAEATYSNIRHQIRRVTFELSPERIDQRIMRVLASRGGVLKISDLALVLNLSEEALFERLKALKEQGYLQYTNKECMLI